MAGGLADEQTDTQAGKESDMDPDGLYIFLFLFLSINLTEQGNLEMPARFLVLYFHPPTCVAIIHGE